jgi:predicted MFS family arabinose efflux permease
MLDGARWVWRHPGVRLAAQLSFFAAFVSQSLQHVSAAVAALVFDRDSTDNAGLLVALGLGALASSGFSVIAGDRLPRSTRVLVALGGFLLSCVMIAATSNYVVGLAGYFIGGMAHLQSAVALNTMIQGCVPEHVRGRTMSFYVLGILLGIPVGSYMLGGLGDLLGMRTALVVNAAIFGVVIAVLLVARLLPDLDTEHIPDDDQSPSLTLTEESLP